MKSSLIYIIALLLLPILRMLVLDVHSELWFGALHWDSAVNAIVWLRRSPLFVSFIGNMALLVFVSAAMLFWLMEGGEADIPKHFLLLPIVYVPFNIVGTVLTTAEFHFSYLFVQPLIILTFGYVYVSLWVLLVWGLTKAGIVK